MSILLALLIGTAQAGAVEAGGTISAVARVGGVGCADGLGACGWVDFRDAAVFSPWVEAKPDTRIQAKARIDLRLHGPTGAARVEEAQDPAQVQPWSLRIRDAWLATRGDHLDLSLGAQRIAWGVANGISVVDTVNPLDLEDPTRFDRRLSTLSAQVTAHSKTLAVTAVAVPFFVPAALPQADVKLMAQETELFTSEGIEVGGLETRGTAPGSTLGNTAGAVQVRWSPPAVDLALSWYHGRDSLPQVAGEVLLVGFQTNSSKVDVGIPLTYPRIDVGGLTARGKLPGEITGWAEVAIVLPERTVAEPSMAQLQSLVQLGTIDEVPSPLPQTVTQDGEPYARWILGLDRELGPVRVTGQWLHGFFTERQASELRDYGLLALRWGLNERVRVDVSGASDLDGWLSDASLTWLHADALELSTGATWIGGPNESAFGGLKAAMGARVRAEMAF
jgi:hypothetical protein